MPSSVVVCETCNPERFETDRSYQPLDASPPNFKANSHEIQKALKDGLLEIGGASEEVIGNLKKMRENDVGDEFIVLINDVREGKTFRWSQKISSRRFKSPCTINTRDLTINRSIMASVGISVFPKDGATADVLVTSTDRAMYVAKWNKSGYSFAQ